jgi:hypothetical protein
MNNDFTQKMKKNTNPHRQIKIKIILNGKSFSDVKENCFTNDTIATIGIIAKTTIAIISLIV